MTINVRKSTIVVSESTAAEWLRTVDPATLKTQNVDLSAIVVYEDGLPAEEIERLIEKAKSGGG